MSPKQVTEYHTLRFAGLFDLQASACVTFRLCTFLKLRTWDNSTCHITSLRFRLELEFHELNAN